MDKIPGSNLSKDDLTEKALSRQQTERKKKLKQISDNRKDDSGPIGLHNLDIDAIHQEFDKYNNIINNVNERKINIKINTAELEANQNRQLLDLKDKAIQAILESQSKNIHDSTYQMKLRTIYNMSPVDIRAYNEECKKRYNERYTNVVRRPLSTTQETGSGQVWEAYTFVHAAHQAWYQARQRGDNPRPPVACYHSEMLLDDGVFRVINATKRRPESIEFQDRKKYPEGLFDEEVQSEDTKPLAHSQIIYNQMRITEQWAKEKGGYTGQFNLSKLEDKDIYEDTTRRMIEQFVKKGEKCVFTVEDSGYQATVDTPLGAGKWYLIHHHYENKAIVAVEMEIDDEGKYNIAYLIENKS